MLRADPPLQVAKIVSNWMWALIYGEVKILVLSAGQVRELQFLGMLRQLIVEFFSSLLSRPSISLSTVSPLPSCRTKSSFVPFRFIQIVNGKEVYTFYFLNQQLSDSITRFDNKIFI